ncbi:MAG TPA: hypothetical protein VHG93_08575 [Longimicrobium sp.]|nr:hypothetical protein [Longimicrobium sp.]
MTLRVLAVLLVASAAACAPMVTHGPRVQPGFTAAATTGGSRALCDTACELDLTPQVAVGVSRGWPATETRPGFSVGANVSVFSSDVDAYVQAPTGWTGALQAGAGGLVGIGHAMPYVQLGRMRQDGSGWYTTQGFVWMYRREARNDGLLMDPGEVDPERVGPDFVAPVYWAPTLAFPGGGETGVTLYVSGAFGTADAWRYDQNGNLHSAGRESIRSVMMGVMLDSRMASRARRTPDARRHAPASSSSTPP